MTLPFAPFLTVWAVLAMNIASPGPNMLDTITTVMGPGRPSGLASAAGVALGVGLWMRLAPAISAAVGLFFAAFAVRLAFGLAG